MRIAWCGMVALALAAALVNGCKSRPRAAFDLTAQAYEIDVDGTPTANTKPAGSLVVASYNVHLMANSEALRADLANLAFVDVWAMQEVPVPRPRGNDSDDEDDDAAARHRQAFRESLKKVLPPGQWHVRAVAVNALAPDGWTCEGQVIASRMPIRDCAVWPLGGEGKRRVALAAFIAGDAGAADDTVAVVNTDHEPSFFSLGAGNDAQVTRLLAHLGRCDPAVIVAGDFNPTGLLWRLRSHPQDLAHLRGVMAGAGFTSAAHADNDTYRGFPSSLRLDHLFLRDLRWLAGGVAAAARGSDHLPVWCRVQPPPLGGRGEDLYGCAGY